MRSIYINGRVFSGKLPLKEAFAAEDGVFLCCGTNAEAMAFARPGDEVTDLAGAFVMPGFIDSHMHILNYGAALTEAPLHLHTQSLADVLQCLRDFLAAGDYGSGRWLIGRGWNQDHFTDEHRMPDRFDLDTVSDTVPILITRACGHCLALNSAAVRAIGLTAATPCPEGGTIGMKDGEPDGRLYDNAMALADDALPVPDKETVKHYLRLACGELAKNGVTGSHSDDYAVYSGLPWETVAEAFRELEESGELTCRVYEQSNFCDPEAFKAFLDKGYVTGAGSDLFRTGPLKMVADGALGARTACLSVPYADDPEAEGLMCYSPELLDTMVDIAVSRDMQVATHAIGDRCLDHVLDAYEKALAKYEKKDRRLGIVHCQITRPDQLDRMAKLGLHIYAQNVFLDYDISIVEQRAGKELASTSYSWKTLMNKGLIVSNGTDCPVETPEPMRGVQCAVTRRTLQGEGPYLEKEAFTVEEALAAYTAAGAYASFEENKKGKIEKGMLADFVILDGDPFAVPAERLSAITPVATYLGGKKVFDRRDR